jgi:hypothetical protein
MVNPELNLFGALCKNLRIPVKWSGDSGDVGRYRSEATLVDFYLSEVDHMSLEVGECLAKL